MQEQDIRTCSAEGCGRRATCKGYCGMHWARVRRYGDPSVLRRLPNGVTKPCTHEGCGNAAMARGLCQRHYDQWRTLHVPGRREMQDEARRRYATANPKDPKKVRLQVLRTKWSLMEEAYVALLGAQGNCCAICEACFDNPLSASVDHDHDCCPYDGSCGACIRGLLCGNCNRALGMMGDDPARLRLAADYLERHKEKS